MNYKRYDLVMAIFPNARGFAYAAFEGPLSPLDWGVSDVYGKEKATKALRLIRRIISALSPDVLIVRDPGEMENKANRRLLSFIREIGDLAAERNIPIVGISRERVRHTFSFLGERPTRSEIVVAIAKRIAAFERYVPRQRKFWESEDRWMGLFDAAALALSFYQSQEKFVFEQLH